MTYLFQFLVRVKNEYYALFEGDYLHVDVVNVQSGERFSSITSKQITSVNY